MSLRSLIFKIARGLLLIWWILSYNSCSSGQNNSNSVCGIIVYEIVADGTLQGTWTLPSYMGKVGTEEATGGIPGKITGQYDVNIFNPEGDNIYQGKLTITLLDSTKRDVYQLVWTSLENRDSYRGLGFKAGKDHLAANYWKE